MTRTRHVLSVLAVAALLTACGHATETALESPTVEAAGSTTEQPEPTVEPTVLTFEEFAALSPEELEALPRELWPPELRLASEFTDEELAEFDDPQREEVPLALFVRMLESMDEYGNVTVKGTGRNKGERATITMVGIFNGMNQQTTVRSGDREFTYLAPEFDSNFVKGNRAFWLHELDFDDPADVPSPDTWVRIDILEMNQIIDRDWRDLFAFRVPRMASPTFIAEAAPAPRERCGDVDCFVIRTEDTGTFYLTTDGTGTLVRYVGPEGSDEDLTFSQWGTTPTVREPAPETIFRP